MSGPFGLRDDDFWGDPFRTLDEVGDRLEREGFHGLVVDAPARVVLDGRRGLPLVGLHRVTFRDSRDQPAAEAVVVASRLEDGRVWAGLLQPPEPADDAAPPAEDDDEDPGEGTYTSNFSADLVEVLGVPRLPGTTLVCAVLLRGLASNQVRSAIVRSPADPVDPAVEALRAAEAEEERPERVDPEPGSPWPSYGAAAGAPEPPAAPGLTLAVAPRAPASGQVVLRGAWRLAARPRDLVRPRADGRPLDVKDPAATAVLPITLVLVGERVVGPYVIDLRVPSHDPAPPDGVVADRVVTGRFALDLMATRALRGRTRQRYHLYALSGDALAGPYALELT